MTCILEDSSGCVGLNELTRITQGQGNCTSNSYDSLQGAAGEGGDKWISLRDIENLEREDLSDLVVKEGKIMALPRLLIWKIRKVLTKQLLKIFRKFGCMKVDFYLLDKNLKEPYPLILKGNTDIN